MGCGSSLSVKAAAPASEPSAGASRASSSIAVVTGAGSGIGRAVAALLVKNGTAVVAVDKCKEGLTILDKSVTNCTADVGTAEGVAAVEKAIGERAVKVLVHASGTLRSAPLLKIDRAGMDGMIGSHMYGPIFLTQALVPHLKRAGGARIILTMGGGSDAHIPTFGGYGATKAAMKTIWLTLRDECADFADVALCMPGIVKTPLWDPCLADKDWLFSSVFGLRLSRGDCHTAVEVAEWYAALLDETKVKGDVFRTTEFLIDNPAHQAGVKITLTTEGKNCIAEGESSAADTLQPESLAASGLHGATSPEPNSFQAVFSINSMKFMGIGTCEEPPSMDSVPTLVSE